MKRNYCIRCDEPMVEALLPHHIVGTYAAELVLCENVPVQRCAQCGQVYFPGHVAALFERVRQGQVKPDHSATLELNALALDSLLAPA